MTTEEQMSLDERYKYLRKMKTRYRQAKRREQGQLLNEMQAVLGLHRKSLIRLMNSPLERQSRSEERGATYGPEVTTAIHIIAESLDYPCAERLTPSLPWMAKHLARHGELRLSESLLEQLTQVSISTVQRRLDALRRDQPRLPRRPARPLNQALRQVPMGRIAWDIGEVGHMETDLVHHCGASSAGEYGHTLQMVDVASGWTERQGILGRSYLVMQDAFQCILERLSFVVREVHPDNGSEFFNDHVLRFWKEKAPRVHLSRSRPYHKNDNPFVEQRNRDPVRAYLGDGRLDTVAQIQALNRLYEQMRLYHNLFQPVMRVQEKVIVSDPGQRTRVRRQYDQARTPFDRLCALGTIAEQQQAQLEELRARTNPRHLLAEIQATLEEIFALPCAIPGQVQDVYLTLRHASHPERSTMSR